MTKIYRQRYLPEELLWLRDDEIVREDDDVILTRWTSLKPRFDFASGVSCYFLHKNFKISKFFGHNGEFLYYYCDIVKPARTADGYVFCDLLVDIILYADGTLKVLDLDELAAAYRQGQIATDDMLLALDVADGLLKAIYSGEFAQISAILDEIG